MMPCPIFQAASAMKLIETELNALIDELGEQLSSYSSERFSIENSWDWAKGESDWVTEWQGVEFPVNLRGTRRPRKLSLRFELTRDLLKNSPWVHATDALLIVAYDPHVGHEWSSEMAVRADGRLVDEDAWTECKASIVEGKLLEWRAASITGAHGWSQKSWLFAVPLRALSSPEALQHAVTNVIGGLLGDVPIAKIPLASLVAWSSDMTGSPLRAAAGQGH